MIYVVGIIILILIIGFSYIFFKYLKLKDINKSLEICYKSIEKSLDEKLNLVNGLLKSIKDEKIKKNFNYSDDLDIYEKEKVLFDVSFNINKYIKDNKVKRLKNKLRDLNTLEESIDGLKDFYNANVLNYNEIFLKKYFNKLFRLLKFKDYKAFKIKKLEEYEIFKN